MKYWIAQIFGVGAMLFLLASYQQKTRNRLVACKLSADVLWTLHYFFLAGTAGMIVNFVGIFRELIFMQREKKKWADCLFWPIFFVGCGWVLGFFTYQNLFDLLPLIASALVTVAIWVKNPRLIKFLNIPVCSMFLIYNCLVGSLVGVLNESLSLCSIGIFFLRESLAKRRQAEKADQKDSGLN